MNMEEISSLQNPKIKNIVKLQKSSERKKQKLFILEGKRELGLAMNAGYEIHQLYILPELYGKIEFDTNVPVYIITKEIYSKIAYRESTEGVLALVRPKSNKLESLKLSKNPMIILLEGVEKPGNLGAVLRSADGCGADAVILCDERADLYNPNVIRSSIGCLFSVQTAVCSNQEALDFLNSKSIKSFAAELEASEFYHRTDLSGPSAIVMGTESTGLTEFWLKHANHRIKIPMKGAIDSLNVSNATAILAYEAMRQRGFDE